MTFEECAQLMQVYNALVCECFQRSLPDNHKLSVARDAMADFINALVFANFNK